MCACLQALQYLRKLCSHPLLVLDPEAPGHAAAVQAAVGLPTATPAAWQAAQPSLHHLHHAPKLLALKELLQVSCIRSCTPTHLSIMMIIEIITITSRMTIMMIIPIANRVSARARCIWSKSELARQTCSQRLDRGVK